MSHIPFAPAVPMNDWRNNEKESIIKPIQEILTELDLARKTNGKFNSIHEGLGVITEEYFELVDAIRSNNMDDILNEATQVAAMALNFLVDFSKEKDKK